jgi:hypothetical protein
MDGMSDVEGECTNIDFGHDYSPSVTEDFLRCTANKTITFLGDSNTRNSFVSLLCRFEHAAWEMGYGTLLPPFSAGDAKANSFTDGYHEAADKQKKESEAGKKESEAGDEGGSESLEDARGRAAQYLAARAKYKKRMQQVEKTRPERSDFQLRREESEDPPFGERNTRFGEREPRHGRRRLVKKRSRFNQGGHGGGYHAAHPKKVHTN